MVQTTVIIEFIQKN